MIDRLWKVYSIQCDNCGIYDFINVSEENGETFTKSLIINGWSYTGIEGEHYCKERKKIKTTKEELV